MRSLEVSRFLAASSICVLCGDVAELEWWCSDDLDEADDDEDDEDEYLGLLQAARSLAEPSRILISRSIFCSRSSS